MSNILLISSWILTNLLWMEFTFTWLKNKILGWFALINLVDVKAFPLERISLEWENDLEEEFSFRLCGHVTLFNAERIFSMNKVAPLSFKCKSS